MRRDIPDGEKLAKLNRDGETLTSLAKRFECSRMTVRYRIRKAGYSVVYQGDSSKVLHQGRLPDGEVLLAEYTMNRATQLAEKYQVSIDAVYKKLHRIPGFTPSRPPSGGAPRKLTPPPDELMGEYNIKGETLSSIGKKYGVSAGTIFNRLNESSLVNRRRGK